MAYICYFYLCQGNETKTEDLFQHMRNDDPSSHDAQTLDSATADQAETQDKANFPEMYSDGEDDEGDSKTETALLYDNEELPVSTIIIRPVTVLLRERRV